MIGEWPYEWLRLKCDKCGRYGQLRKTTLLKHFSPSLPTIYVIEHLAACNRGRGITNGRKMGQASCGVYLPDLVIRSNPSLPWRPGER